MKNAYNNYINNSKFNKTLKRNQNSLDELRKSNDNT